MGSTPSPQDVQALIATGISEWEAATATYGGMVKKYGSDTSKWPATAHTTKMVNALTAASAEAGQLIAPPPPPPPPPPSGGDVPPGLTVGGLKFSEEFDGPAGSKPDTSKWEAKTDVQSGTNMDGFNNVHLDGNSNLVVAANVISGVPHSAWMSSEPSGFYTGQRYVVARAKCAPGQGAWSAPVWEGAYPWDGAGLEVDVCEQLGTKDGNAYHTTVHHWDGGTNPQHGQKDAVSVDPTTDFHLYGAAVYPARIDFYFDNAKVYTVLNTDVAVTDFTTFQVIQNISLYVGGWGGAIGLTSTEMAVDFIRVYALS